LRAGLLSQPEVIQRLNQQFVTTTLSYFELLQLARSENALAREVLLHWQTPLVLVFLSPEGRFVTKLSSLTDLTQVHPDTTKRPEAPQYHSLESDVNNARVFLKHLNRHFPNQGNP
jgi:hypothetical protein